MITKILFVRHGQTDWNVKGKWQGHADVPLNETGKSQAAALAKRLQGWPISAIVTSDLQRCVQTAQPIGEAVGLEPKPDPIWRERDVGAFSGLTGDEAKKAFPEIWANAQRGMVDPPNGEGYLDLRKRGIAAYEKVLADYPGKMVVVVSHGGLLHTLIAQLIEIPEDKYGRISKRGNTGLSIVEVKEDIPRLVLLNDTSHLENLSVSLSEA
jgi:broad specificity phosphatase PhoE